MGAVIAIAAKDLRQKLRDRSAIILSVVAPLTLAYLFSVMLPSGGSSFHAAYAVVDQDGGSVARALIDGPLAALSRAGVADIVTLEQPADARSRVETGQAAAAIVIPAGFSDAAQAGRPSKIEIIGSADATLATQIATAVVQGFALSVEAVQVSVGTVLAAAPAPSDPAVTARLVQEAVAIASPIQLVEDRTQDRVASTTTFYGASMAVLFVFFAVQFGVLSLLSERRAGTLARMLAAPISPRTVLLGKVLVSIVLGVLSMTIMVVATTLLMNARWGDPVAVGGLILATVLAASGIALLVVGFARTEDQAGSLTAIVAMTLAVLGGSFFPMSQAPAFMAQLSLITPHAWFLQGINDLASGAGIGAVVPSLVVLSAIGVATGGLGLLRARKVVLA